MDEKSTDRGVVGKVVRGTLSDDRKRDAGKFQDVPALKF